MNQSELKAFCSVDKTRPHLLHPFSHAQWSFATDGRILIRVPRHGGIPISPDGGVTQPPSLESINGLFERHKTVPHQVPSNLPPLRGPFKCEHCAGGGKCECWKCEKEMGDGVCRFCEKGLIEEEAHRVSIGIHYLSHLYLHKIRTLPGIVIYENDQRLAEPEHGPCYLKFIGGDGVLMPMTKP